MAPSHRRAARHHSCPLPGCNFRGRQADLEIHYREIHSRNGARVPDIPVLSGERGLHEYGFSDHPPLNLGFRIPILAANNPTGLHFPQAPAQPAVTGLLNGTSATGRIPYYADDEILRYQEVLRLQLSQDFAPHAAVDNNPFDVDDEGSASQTIMPLPVDNVEFILDEDIFNLPFDDGNAQYGQAMPLDAEAPLDLDALFPGQTISLEEFNSFFEQDPLLGVDFPADDIMGDAFDGSDCLIGSYELWDEDLFLAYDYLGEEN
ncbi:hypothetical protein NA57DRAFT_59833 [Rhizodiscina lignyota]|uniref:Uncharacterized protein n=1 Tax=Rhizodiscina lignyota TaxID=1504668 RepID=A0A9P4I701_9PEZI|nr:hypothetical protein NA57DRAFT_59833 [Rhizodiscina lignyota]